MNAASERGSSDEARPGRTVTRDPELMRALSHPARLAILEHLAAYGGEITATEAAEIVGLSPSATSYHLRALAKVDMIREAPSRGDGRERVYAGLPSRKVDISAEVNPADPASKMAREQLLDAILTRADERVRRWREHMDEETQEWFDASAIHEGFVMVTPDELREIFDRLVEVLEPYRRSVRSAPPEGARLVSIQVRGIPVR